MKHTRHQWDWSVNGGEYCSICKKPRDQVAAKRSRSSGRLGKDVERRLAKRFGWRKVGQFGDAVDLIGTHVKVQSKASRANPPAYFPRIIVPMGNVKWATEPLDKMDGLYPTRWPVLVKSYVHAGLPTKSWVVVRAADWAKAGYAQWAPYNPAGSPLLLMPGSYWLEVVGEDS